MKRLILIGVSVAFVAGCSTSPRPSSYAGTTRIDVSGTLGVAVAGFYVQDGQRITISNGVPWSLDVPRLFRLEVSLPHPGGEAVVDLTYDSSGTRSHVRQTLGSGCTGAPFVASTKDLDKDIEVCDGVIVMTPLHCP